MTEWEAHSRYNYSKLADEERRAFDRWQSNAAFTSSLFALALLAMAVSAWLLPEPAPTMTAATHAATDGRSTHESVVRVGQHLPAQETDNPF